METLKVSSLGQPVRKSGEMLSTLFLLTSSSLISGKHSGTQSSVTLLLKRERREITAVLITLDASHCHTARHIEMRRCNDTLPFHKQLLQLVHGAAQLAREGLDLVEGQIELPQRRAVDGGVEGQQGAHAVTGDVQHAQREQGQQLHRQSLELVALQVQSSQTLQTLTVTKKKKTVCFL